LCSMPRNKISEYGQIHFGLESIVEGYLQIYNEMIEQE